MPKIISATEAVNDIDNGATVMFGGFLAVGTPETLINALIAKDIRDLTIICNDTGFIDKGVGKLIVQRRVKKLYASHIGTNPETGKQINAKEIEADIIPQGTLAERVRAGGAGLGGFLTPTGLGTVVEEGKQIIEVNSKPYLLELPLQADFALLHAKAADKAGNLLFHGTAQNFNPLMAMAAATVIAEVDELIDDYFDPNIVHTPGFLVDYLVKREG
ncbi:CoA transferase subunit A [Syntrophomonas curvata]